MSRDLPDDRTQGDWLEDALRSRPAMTAPEGFTAKMMEQLASSAPPSIPQSTEWIEEAGRAGLLFAALGAASVLDARLLTEWLNGLVEPAPLVIVAVTLLVAGVWYSAQRSLDLEI
jgi:hypothetical protein